MMILNEINQINKNENSLNKLISLLMLFILVVTNVSALVEIDFVNLEENFILGDKISFEFTITSDIEENIEYSAVGLCPGLAPPAPEFISASIGPGAPLTETYVYISEVDETIEPQLLCHVKIGVLGAVNSPLVEERPFSIATKPSFFFDINFCEDVLCSEEVLVFERKENVYINYFSEITEPIITATLTSPDGETQNIILPFNFEPNENGAYSLEIVASAENYKTFTQTYNFAVIEESAEIGDAEVIPYEEQSDYDPENFYWTNAYNENISIAQVGTTARMVAVEPNGAYFEIFEYDSLLGGNDDIRVGNRNHIRGIDYDGILIGKWEITDYDYSLSSDHGDYNFVNGGKRSGKLELIPRDYDANFCEDYLDKDYCNSCSDYSCSVARSSVNSLVSDFGAECGEVIGDDGYIMDCFCKWDIEEKECNSGFRAIPPSVNNEKIGECVFFSDSDDNCDDGFFEVSWKSVWEWHNDNGFDSLGLRDNCKDGARGIPCPAQIKLSFFGFMQIVFSLFLIGFVYFIYFVLRKKKIKIISKL